MPISVQPLVLNYSFEAHKHQAVDRVDAAQLDAALAQITEKLNEIIYALDETLRDDDTLRDNSIEPRHLAPEVYEALTALVREVQPL